MVVCTKCGAKNEEEAKFCVKCGLNLETGAPPPRPRKRQHKHEEDCFGIRREEECFGIPRGGSIVGLAIGILIVLWGLLWLLGQVFPDQMPDVEIGPFAAIVFGVLILVGAIYGLSRR